MPVWNGQAYLEESINSIFGQTFSNFELIVVDDGSTDGTAKILASSHDPRLRVFRLEHAGIVMALNFGIAQARGDWVARHDADDISLPRRLEVQWRAVQCNPHAVLAHTNVEFVGEGIPAKQVRFPKTRAFMALRLCYLCPIVHSTVFFKKETAVAVGGYLPEERHAEDYSLWGRMLEHGEFISLPKKLVKLRIHELSVSKQNLEMQMALTEKIAARHCQNFMHLSHKDAEKAQAIMRTLPRERRWVDWLWFLTRCAPRLRWKSAETYGWLLLQTVKQISGKSVIAKRAA